MMQTPSRQEASTSGKVREAITERSAARRQADDFQHRWYRLVAENQQILDKLAR